MGYRAPSAEDVYRYALRTDLRRRSLSDGFGFSIVFVNDDSDLCHDIISNYFVDLCERTADRIRIIFFSDLPLHEMEGIADALTQGRIRGDDGFLGTVIRRLGRRPSPIASVLLEALHARDHHRLEMILDRVSSEIGRGPARALYDLFERYLYNSDFEDVGELILGLERVFQFRTTSYPEDQGRYAGGRSPRLSDLTPEFLHPIHEPRRSRNLSMEAELNSSVPGVGEAMRFAQLMGIGAEMPCFVFFTDIGEPSVEVFPIARLSSREVYKNVRDWIDRFYALNQGTIQKWSDAEDEMDDYIRSANNSLSQISQISYKLSNGWEEYKKLKILTYRMSVSKEFSLGILSGEVESGLPWRLQSTLRTHKEKFAKQQREFSELGGIVQVKRNLESFLNNSIEPTALAKVIKDAQDELPRTDAAEGLRLLLSSSTEEIGLLSQQERVSEPKSRIFRWWREIQAELPSGKKLKGTLRKAGEHGYEILPSDWKRIQAELIEVCFAEQLSVGESATSRVVDTALRSAFKENSAGEFEIAPFVPLKDQLLKLMSVVRNGLDEGYREILAEEKISDVVPVRDRDQLTFSRACSIMLDCEPICRAMEKFNEIAAEEAKLMATKTQEIVVKIQGEIGEFEVEQIDIESLRQQVANEVVSDLQSKMLQIEADIAGDIDISLFDDFLDKVDFENGKVRAFLDTLSDYEDAVSSLVFPHRESPLIKEWLLPSDTRSLLSLGSRHDSDFQTKSELLKSDFVAVAERVSQAPEEQDRLRRQAVAELPLARLTRALLVASGEIERDLVLPSVFGTEWFSNLQSTVDQLPENKIDELVGLLTTDNTVLNSTEDKVGFLKYYLSMDWQVGEEHLRTSGQAEAGLSAQIRQLDAAFSLQMQRLFSLERELAIGADVDQRVRIEQTIKHDIIPKICDIEAKFADVFCMMLEEVAVGSDIEQVVRSMLEIHAERQRSVVQQLFTKLMQQLSIKEDMSDEQTSKAVVDRQLTEVIYKTASEACKEAEPGIEKRVRPVWHRAKALVRQSYLVS